MKLSKKLAWATSLLCLLSCTVPWVAILSGGLGLSVIGTVTGSMSQTLRCLLQAGLVMAVYLGYCAVRAKQTRCAPTDSSSNTVCATPATEK